MALTELPPPTTFPCMMSTALDHWFGQIYEATNTEEFGRRWRPMIEDMLARSMNDRGWYYERRLERQVLGFEAATVLARMRGHSELFLSIRDLYKAWAEARLGGDEDDLAGFCAFLSTPAGTPLRIDGLEWIAAALRASPNARNWYRETTGSAFMGLLDTAVLENPAEVSTNETARHALLELVAHAVSRQLPAALALQERIRKML